MVTAKKKSVRSSAKDMARKSLTHPPWIDMITECITTTPDGTRHGVSRLAIKKFVDSKYHLSIDAATASRLNRAITHGTLAGNFVLPKGPSGKVRLATQKLGETAKENKKPKHPTVTKSKGRAVSSKSKIAPFVEEQASKSMPGIRKYTSTAKKARLNPTLGRKAPSRRATTQRDGAKRVLTRSSAATTRVRRGTTKSKKRPSK